MKGKFVAHTNLMQIEAALKEHKPYSALVVSTTGLDNADFSDHSPTRIVMQEFEYDEELKSYKPTIGFDRMVKAPQAAIDKAVANTSVYDVFASGGIDRDKYIAGENVLSVEDFQKEFSSFISALKEDGSILIINGDRKFAENYLGKIGCADGIVSLAENGKVIEQTRMTQEYFEKAGIASKSAKLEDLRDVVLKNEETQGKIIGGDNRIKVINSFITKYGRDEKLLADERQERQREADNAIREDMSKNGKEKYKNSGLDDKFNTLVEQGALNPDNILQGNSEFHKLIGVIEGKNNAKGNKGIIIMHAASTGFEYGKPPKSTGFPIQFTALVFKRGEDGKLNMQQKPSGVSFNIEAPSKSLQNAIKNINDPRRPYDTFKETGIDLEEYKAKINVASADEAIARVNKLFKKFPIEDYAIIAIGGTKDSDYSFTQTCMSNLGNFAMCEADYIDFAQAIKDYSYLAHIDDKYPENILFDEFAFNKGKTFSIRDVAEARGDVRPASTQAMCQETAKLIYLMEKQQVELFRPEELIAQDPKPVEKSADAPALTPKAQSSLAETLSSNGEETFIGDGYDNVETSLTEEQIQAEKELKDETFNKMLDDDLGLRSRSKDNAKPGTMNSRVSRSSPLFESIARRNTESSYSGFTAARQNSSSTHPMSSPAGSVPRGTDYTANERNRTAKRQDERQTVAPERGSTDMSRLLDIIEKQNAVIVEMNNRLADVVEQTTNRLMTVVERQDELTKFVIQTLADKANVQGRQELLFRESIQTSSPEVSPESKLEGAIAAIDEVSNNVPTNRAQTHLLNARQALCGAVSEIDRANRDKTQRTAS